MSDNDELDLELIVKAAVSLSPELRAKFVGSLPPAQRANVINRLAVKDLPNPLHDAEIRPPTVVVRPSTIIDESHTDEQSREPLTVVDNWGQSTQDKTVVMSQDYDERSLSKQQVAVVADDSIDASETISRLDGESTIRLVRQHARGAIGEVFVAFDDQLSREVALKRIRADLPENQRRVNRFIREAVITAKLQHPGIVPIYNLGDDGKSTHYTMPLVSGLTLTSLIKKTHRDIGLRTSASEWISKIRPVLIHFIAVCNAIDYAHSQEVLHRDLKPSNIIIGTQGQTLVLDWGCAKHIGEVESNDGPISNSAGKNDTTVDGSILGTVQFMSPEQASGDNASLGVASDIFGLGATLFSILTNDVAIEPAEDLQTSLDQVKAGNFRRVEDVSARVPAPLAAICHCAMSPRPEDRYAMAGDLGRDIDAFLAGEEVHAYKESRFDLAKRFVRQHHSAATALLGALFVGCLSLILVTLMIQKQRHILSTKNSELDSLNGQLERSVSTEKRLTLAGIEREATIQRKLYETEMLLASEASTEAGGIGRMRELVDRWRDPEVASLRGWEWVHLDALGRREIWKAKLEATSNRAITTRDHPHARLFDSGRSILTTIDVDAHQIVSQRQLPECVRVIDFNRDQSLMAMGFDNGDVVVVNTSDETAEEIQLTRLKSAVTDLRWNIGGDYLAVSGSSGEMEVWHWFKRELERTATNVLNHPGKGLLTWSYDGKQIAWTTGTEIHGMDVASGDDKVLATDKWITSPCWSHEGRLLAYIGPDNEIATVDFDSTATHRFKGHHLFIESLSWHPTRHLLLSASSDGTVRIWNADTHKQIRQLLGHGSSVYSAAWRRDGEAVISGGLPEDSVRLWDMVNVGNNVFDQELMSHPSVDWHPDGDRFVVAHGTDLVIQTRDSEPTWIRGSGKTPQEILGIDVDPSGKKIACVSATGRVWSVAIDSGKILNVYSNGGTPRLFPATSTKGVAWSHDGRFLAGIGDNGRFHVWDTETRKDIVPADASVDGILVVAWKPNSSTGPPILAYAGTHDEVFVFDTSTCQSSSQIIQDGWKNALTWSPNGDRIAIGHRRTINILDANTGKLISKCEGPSAMILDMSWSKSQDRIAALSEDGRVSIWNSSNWGYCGKFTLHSRSPYAIAWSPDGERLVSTSRYGRIVSQGIDP